MPSDVARRLAYADDTNPSVLSSRADAIDAALQRAWEAGRNAAADRLSGIIVVGSEALELRALKYPGAAAVLRDSDGP
jgi:hypothetical protein